MIFSCYGNSCSSPLLPLVNSLPPRNDLRNNNAAAFLSYIGDSLLLLLLLTFTYLSFPGGDLSANFLTYNVSTINFSEIVFERVEVLSKFATYWVGTLIRGGRVAIYVPQKYTICKYHRLPGLREVVSYFGNNQHKLTRQGCDLGSLKCVLMRKLCSYIHHRWKEFIIPVALFTSYSSPFYRTKVFFDDVFITTIWIYTISVCNVNCCWENRSLIFMTLRWHYDTTYSHPQE